MKHKHHYIFSLCLSLILLDACKNRESAQEETVAEARTPVTVEAVSTGSLNEYIELNATSAFLQKSYVKSNVNGYLQTADVRLGQYVSKGQGLFSVKTKESQSIGNTLTQLDSTFKFTGINHIHASDNGYITQLNHLNGDYVQDGEQLAVISNMGSFVFLLELPYELRQYVQGNGTVELVLPGGEKLNGRIESFMPTVDAASQTQSLIIRVNAGHPIPENLVARVRILKSAKSAAISVPKSALLTDETQSNFWVMKMIDSATAVKIPVQKGIESAGRVEILSPRFSAGDLVLVGGNYGLPDTAKVKIEQVPTQQEK